MATSHIALRIWGRLNVENPGRQARCCPGQPWGALDASGALPQCRLFEQVILEDRVEKEAARQKMERDALELKSVLKVRGEVGAPHAAP